MQTNRGFTTVQWLLTAAVLGAGGYLGYRYWQKPATPPVEFRTAKVTRGSIVQLVTANGALSPVRTVEVGSQISGTLKEINVDFNSKVKEGEVIAQIDPATYERALGQAEAELAQLNFERATNLFAEKITSKADYDEARVNLSQAKATVKTRQANVDRAKVDLSRTTIYAPMDGIVITRKVEVGQTVAASMNTPTLFVIANDLKQMRIEAAVSEADVGGVEEGQTVQFDVDAFLGRKFEGKVQQVRYAPTTNQNVVTYTTIVAVENQDLKLRPGMTANTKIITAERRDVIKMPNAALRFRPPEGTVVEGDTHSPAPAVALIESGPFAGLPIMPWQANGERRRPTEEERTAYTASLTAEQKEKYEKALAEMRARFAQGGGVGGGGTEGGGRERRRTESEGPKSATVYVLENPSSSGTGGPTKLKPVTVKLGISDGTNTEVTEGLHEGDVVVTGVITTSSTAAASSGANPFGNPFARGRRPR
jgi:HlyD family secretion protein